LWRAAANFELLENACGRQRVEILRCGYSRDIEISRHEPDLGIGIREEVVDQILGVHLRELSPNAVLHLEQGRSDFADLLDAVPCARGHGVQHVENPVLPAPIVPYCLQ